MARSVIVKLDEDVPLAISQLTLLAVCVTVEIFPSAVDTLVVIEVRLWLIVEMEPSVFSMRVLNPLTVWESVEILPSASSIRVLKPLTVLSMVGLRLLKLQVRLSS